jgi:aspartate carbamoyltransferase catalytic subunit
MNRGVEIAGDVADLPQTLVIDQVRNGVAVRMAVLFLVLSADNETGLAAAKETER